MDLCFVGDHSWSSFWFSNKQHYLSISFLSVYMCVRMPLSSRSIAGVPSSRALLVFPPHHRDMCAFLIDGCVATKQQKKMETSVTQKNLTWSNWRFVTKTFESKYHFFFWESPSSPWSFFWNPERWGSTANCTPFMGHGTVTVISLGTVLGTVSPIIISEMEMWRCPDYLFTVAESRGGII